MLKAVHLIYEQGTEMDAALWKPRKVVIIGAGAVVRLLPTRWLREVWLTRLSCWTPIGNRHGQVLDLAHGQAFFPSS